MILRAYGNDSSIDLFENHLVITRRRPGFFVDAPSLEQMVPLSSIKSVQFIRPGLFAHGRIVLSLVGNSSIKPGTVADENTVFFRKNKLRQFEDLLHAIREAIATPSIERLAMAAQRSARVGHIQPAPTENRLVRIASQPNGQGSKTRQRDDDTDGHAHYTYVHQSENRPRPLNPAIVGLWRDMPLLGKVLIVGFAVVLLPSMCTSGDSSPVEGSTNEAPAHNPIVGEWIFAERGGEDGQTYCKVAASNRDFALRQGKFAAMRFADDGTYGQILMSFKLDAHFEAEGTYIYKGNDLHLTNQSARVGKLSGAGNLNELDEPGTSDVVVSFVGENVMILSANNRSDRMVRCR